MTRRSNFVSHPRPRPVTLVEEGEPRKAPVPGHAFPAGNVTRRKGSSPSPTLEEGGGVQAIPDNPLEETKRPSALESLLAEVTALASQLRKPRTFLGSQGTSAGRRNILQMLHLYGPQTVPQIARRLQTSRQNVQVLVNRLQAEGSVEFSPNPAHKRSDLVALSSRGSILAAAVGQRESDLLENLASRISGADLLAATELLSELRQVLRLRAQPRVQRNPLNIPAASEEPARPQPEGEPAGTDLPVNLL
jgi:DNA-binding MarR family transcriptional regulator